LCIFNLLRKNQKSNIFHHLVLGLINGFKSRYLAIDVNLITFWWLQNIPLYIGTKLISHGIASSACVRTPAWQPIIINNHIPLSSNFGRLKRMHKATKLLQTMPTVQQSDATNKDTQPGESESRSAQ